MKITDFSPIHLLLIAGLSLSACSSSSGGTSATRSASVSSGPLSTEEQRLRQQNDAFTLTVVEGAVAGAVIGGLIGGLVTGDWSGALIGAGAGAVAGGASGAYVASRQKEYANEEARIDAMIVDLRQDNNNLRKYIVTAEEVIAADHRKLADLNQQYANQQINRKEARQQLARIRENRDVIAETAETLEKKRQEYVYAAQETRRQNPSANLHEMERQIAMLEDNIDALETDLDSLTEALEVSPVAAVG